MYITTYYIKNPSKLQDYYYFLCLPLSGHITPCKKGQKKAALAAFPMANTQAILWIPKYYPLSV